MMELEILGLYVMEGSQNLGLNKRMCSKILQMGQQKNSGAN